MGLRTFCDEEPLIFGLVQGLTLFDGCSLSTSLLVSLVLESRILRTAWYLRFLRVTKVQSSTLLSLWLSISSEPSGFFLGTSTLTGAQLPKCKKVAFDGDLEHFFWFGATLAWFASNVSSWSMMIFPSLTNIMIFSFKIKHLLLRWPRTRWNFQYLGSPTLLISSGLLHSGRSITFLASNSSRIIGTYESGNG